MNDITAEFESLSPVKRALFEKKLLTRNLPAIRQRLATRSQEPRPLSSGQKSLWFFDQLEFNSALYNLPRASRLQGPLNIEALRKSFEMIVERHEALRTNFILVGDVPMQVVAPNREFALPVFDVAALPERERQQEVQRRIAEEANRPFDLASDRMLRAMLLRSADDENILCVLRPSHCRRRVVS